MAGQGNLERTWKVREFENKWLCMAGSLRNGRWHKIVNSCKTSIIINSYIIIYIFIAVYLSFV